MDMRILREEGQPALVESELPWSETLSTLQGLALARNSHAFDLLVRGVAWHHRSASDIIGVIRLALEVWGFACGARSFSYSQLLE
jgi:hypothetical protein